MGSHLVIRQLDAHLTKWQRHFIMIIGSVAHFLCHFGHAPLIILRGGLFTGILVCREVHLKHSSEGRDLFNF